MTLHVNYRPILAHAAEASKCELKFEMRSEIRNNLISLIELKLN